MALIRRRVTDFESFDIHTSAEFDLTSYTYPRLLGPGLIRAIHFRVLPSSHALTKHPPIDSAFRLRVMLHKLLIGNRNHIQGPGVLSPLRPASDALQVRAGESVQLIFSHPPTPCRIVGYIELIHLEP